MLQGEVQVIGLRPWFDQKTQKEKKKHELFTTVQSVAKLFETLPSIIEKIPEHERWNVYFTALNCEDPRNVKGQLRRFKSQEIFPFDIDGIAQSEQQKYIDVFFQVTGFDIAKTIVICSGNGLQFFVQFDKPFLDPEYFEQKRFQYKAICERVDKTLAELKIPGRADPSVWSPARIMRLPNTINRKPKKEDKLAYIIGGSVLLPQEVLWDKISGISEIAKDEQVPWDDARAIKLDHKEIYKGCDFLRSTIEHPETIREPHFYAAISIIARMENGRDRVHKLAESIRDSGSDSTVVGYSHADIDKKIDQALVNSGPRTCKSINTIYGKCAKCPMFGKCVSPVSLKGEEHIATENSGFYSTNKEGKLAPNYNDLLKFFDRKYAHKTLDQNGAPYIFTGTHYKPITKTVLKSFAQQNFNPPPSQDKVREEFTKIIACTNLVERKFFEDNINGFTNFRNGVLNLKTKELMPHGPHWGFKYVLPFDYDPTAKAERFDKYMDEITCNDKDLRAVLEEFGGYALSGDEYWSHHCLLMTGGGRNGKSKFVETLQMLAGEDNYSATKIEKFNSQNDLQLMEGALFNISEEISPKDLKMTEIIKDLSSGNTITVKLMWNHPHKMKNRTKLLMTCNKTPATEDLSVAFLERVIIVPFNRYFKEDERDYFLMDTFKKELAGIYNIFLSGYDRLRKNRVFTKAVAIQEKKDEYAMENNPLAPWFESAVAKGDLIVKPLNGKQDFTLASDLYDDFLRWNQDHGNILRVDSRTFGHYLSAIFTNGKERRDRLRWSLVNGSRAKEFPNQRWGYYDVVYKNDAPFQ